MSERICVVIVTFNNANMLANLLDDLRIQSRQSDEVIVIDNASRDHTETLVRGHHPEVNYIRLGENLGSAGGYHEGIRRALPSSDFIYTLDDDVRLDTNTLEEIIKGFYLLEETLPNRIAAVRSVGTKHHESVPTLLEIAPWRGTLFKAAVVREVGLPSPDYFLYGEDLEYSLRITRKGFCFYWIPASLCQEGIRARDSKTSATFFDKRFVLYQDPFRLYYAFRNEIFIHRQYHQLLKGFRLLLYAAKVVLMVLISEGWSGSKAVRAVCQGLMDGFRGILGKNVNYNPA